MTKQEYDNNPKLCEYCKQPILRKPNEMPTRLKNRKYCSRKCACMVANQVKSEKCKKEFFCINCGESLGFGLSEARRKQYCDNCNPSKIDWSTVTYGEVKNKRGYQKHSRIRILAQKIYQVKTNGNMVCEKCGYDKHIEVCHIKPISSYPDEALISEINHPNNLIGLCPNCHWELDNL